MFRINIRYARLIKKYNDQFIQNLQVCKVSSLNFYDTLVCHACRYQELFGEFGVLDIIRSVSLMDRRHKIVFYIYIHIYLLPRV